MQSRCCWPPESEPPGLSSRSLTSRHRPARVRLASTSSSGSATLILLSLGPASTFWAMVIAGKGLGFWNTMPMCRRTTVGREEGP